MSDPRVQVHFYSESQHVPPGKGVREVGELHFAGLLRDIPDWRRALSNLSVTTPFAWKGNRAQLAGWGLPEGIPGLPDEGLEGDCIWRSVEHAFQGAKMYLSHDGSTASRADTLAAA